MENLGRITLMIILLICSFLIALLKTYVIISVSHLYQLCFITQFSFVQVYGVIALITLISYRYKKNKDIEFKVAYMKAISGLISTVLFILLSWGITCIAYYVIR